MGVTEILTNENLTNREKLDKLLELKKEYIFFEIDIRKGFPRFYDYCSNWENELGNKIRYFWDNCIYHRNKYSLARKTAMKDILEEYGDKAISFDKDIFFNAESRVNEEDQLVYLKDIDIQSRLVDYYPENRQDNDVMEFITLPKQKEVEKEIEEEFSKTDNSLTGNDFPIPQELLETTRKSDEISPSTFNKKILELVEKKKKKQLKKKLRWEEEFYEKNIKGIEPERFNKFLIVLTLLGKISITEGTLISMCNTIHEKFKRVYDYIGKEVEKQFHTFELNYEGWISIYINEILYKRE